MNGSWLFLNFFLFPGITLFKNIRLKGFPFTGKKSSSSFDLSLTPFKYLAFQIRRKRFILQQLWRGLQLYLKPYHVIKFSTPNVAFLMFWLVYSTPVISSYSIWADHFIRRLFDTRLVILHSTLRISLASYHLISKMH